MLFYLVVVSETVLKQVQILSTQKGSCLLILCVCSDFFVYCIHFVFD